MSDDSNNNSDFTQARSPKPDANADHAAGSMIGPYKLLQKLGEGGMGEVWMAEQAAPVQRRVALKLIRSDKAGKNVLARFEAERQALALMDHPNIARVLDAGATESDRPYVVMELVKGIPFHQYCDHERLTPRDRLELFLPVCQAVQHAHQKGIIHRDLKPSNVLIALYDGKPVPKVIDFGIAKATSRKLTEKTMFTEVGQIVGTLEYMAPEQAELNNLDIDTRADVYSLGVMLYELLTGATPFSAKELRGGAFREMIRILHDVDPPKPSTRLSKSDELSVIASKRKLEPKALSRLIKGELDWIVMKCLEKDRARRYESANQLGEDLKRYLSDEPVQAGPPSAGYRARKFLMRNKGPVAGAAVVLVALVGGVVGTTLGLIQARSAREAALANEAKAIEAAALERQALATAEQRLDQVAKANRIIDSLCKEMDPRPNHPQTEAQRQAEDQRRAQRLDQLVDGLGASGIGDRKIMGRLRNTLGILLVSRGGSMQKAVDLLAQAKVDLEATLGPAAPDTLDVIVNLARAYSYNGERDRSAAMLELVLERRKGALDPNDSGLIAVMRDLGQELQSSGEYVKASSLLQRVFDAQRVTLGPHHADTIQTMQSLAWLAATSGDGEKALALFRSVLEATEAAKGIRDSATTQAAADVARTTLSTRGRADAIAFATQAIETRTAKLGPEELETIALQELTADLFLEGSEPAKGIAMLETAFEVRRRRYSADHVKAAQAANNLCYAYSRTRQFEKALALAASLVEDDAKRYGRDAPETLRRTEELATFYCQANQAKRGIELYEQTLRKRQVKQGADHEDTISTLSQLANQCLHADRNQDALAYFEEVFTALKRSKSEDHPRTLQAMVDLANVQVTVGRAKDAVALFERMLSLHKSRFGPDHPETLDKVMAFAALLERLGEESKALEMYEAAWIGRRDRFGETHAESLRALETLGFACSRTGRHKAAIRHLETALESRRAKTGDNSHDTLQAMNALASAYGAAKAHLRAVGLYESAATLTGKRHGSDSRDALAASSALAGAHAEAKQHEKAIAVFESILSKQGPYRTDDDPDPFGATFGLARAYLGAGKHTLGTDVFRRYLDERRKHLTGKAAALSGDLQSVAEALLDFKHYGEAEPLLIEARKRNGLSQEMLAWNELLLGLSRLGQKPSADAQASIAKGVQNLTNRDKMIRSSKERLIEWLEHAADLFDAAGDSAQATRHRQLAASARTALVVEK